MYTNRVQPFCLIVFLCFLCHFIIFSHQQTFRQVGNKPFRNGAPSVMKVSPIPHSLPIEHDVWGLEDKAPYATNSWFENIVLGNNQNPIALYPYVMTVVNDGLHVSYTKPTLSPDNINLGTPFMNQFTLTAIEVLSKKPFIERYDKLSLTIRWNTQRGFMQSFLVRGQPFVTSNYTMSTPVIITQFPVVSINNVPVSNQQVFRSDKLRLQLNDGSTWMLYTQTPVAIEVTNVNYLKMLAQYNGWVRLARAVSGDHENVLTTFKDTIPLSGNVGYYVSDNIAKIVFKYKTVGSGSLLMNVLPHHLEIMKPQDYSLPLGKTIRTTTVKGNMTAVIANNDQLLFYEPLTIIEFDSDLKYASASDIELLRQSLRNDMNVKPVDTDAYFFGKQVAKMARLALIADQLGEDSIASHIRENMKQVLTPWLVSTPSSINYFVFENTYRGIVSWNAIKSGDPNAEFGNSYYNDHHFHYGYHVYAAAVIAKKDRTWAIQYKDYIIDLIRDYASPVRDNYFPELRMKDPYVGCSFASGLFEFELSRNQESTSESVNAYYAMYLYGKVIGEDDIAQMGRILLAQEIRSAKTYWQITKNSVIYNYAPSFAEHKVVGIIWELMAVYATWFGSQTEFIHCIQMLPFTPISEELLGREWINDEYSVLSTSLTRNNPPISEGWRGYVYMAHAIINRISARREIDTLTDYDDGNTRTNTLYWVITRP
ncbi:hypothetical protein ABK040_006761 [Willaertia magna]